ncbi:MAG: iron-containing alcohol dehydrogenase [Spongiibacter marinus]|uniref:iron-containing alcohol dehydrogenase n=1 Tax=Spongiibacter marinus TaxID=354246 RepID=UPI003C380CD4
MPVAKFRSAKQLLTGSGAIDQLRDYLQSQNIQHPLLVTDKGVRRSGSLAYITEAAGTSDMGIFDEVPAEPEVDVVKACTNYFCSHNFDGIVAVGGGSAIDIAKCTAVMASHEGPLESLFGEGMVKQRNVPLIAIPTTAGTGSEVTNIAILSDPKAQLKKGIVSDYLLPDLAIVSPEMTLTCPPSVTAASGVDALVHAIEAYLSNFASPITDALATKAMALIINALPKAYAKPDNMSAREDMATGSLMAGLAFGNAGVGAVHALAYPLGGRYHISHGVSNALLLPHVMQVNKMACIERFSDIAVAFGERPDLDHHSAANRVIERLHALCRDVNIPANLRALNIPEQDLPSLAEEALGVERLLRNNPRTLSLQDILGIYQAAF